MNDREWQVRELPEIDYVIRGAVVEKNDAVYDVEAHSIAARDPGSGVPLFMVQTGDTMTASMDEAGCEASGYIKWDSCANINLPTHFCGPGEAAKMAPLLLAMFDLAKGVLLPLHPHAADMWDGK